MKAYPDVPSPWVIRFAPLMRQGGVVLDLACGGGRHARHLAMRGHRVLAVDRDAQALAGLETLPGVEAFCFDLERGSWPFPGRAFDGVVVTNYLHRPLLPLIVDALAEGGILIYETFMKGHERFGRPTTRDFLLVPGELLAACDKLGIIAFEQGRLESAVLQRLCAARGAVETFPLPSAT